jgi:hypothetical protein
MVIDGQIVEIKSFKLTNNHTRPVKPLKTSAFTGVFEVSGEMTAYFQNDALLAAILARPHKAAVWQSLRPKLYRAVAYGALAAALSFLLISGAS